MSHPYKSQAERSAKAKCKQLGGGVGITDSDRKVATDKLRAAHEILGRTTEGARRKMGNDEHKARIISDMVPRREEKFGGRLPTAGMEGGMGRLQLSRIQKAKRT